jgi:hypothetical protein
MNFRCSEKIMATENLSAVVVLRVEEYAMDNKKWFTDFSRYFSQVLEASEASSLKEVQRVSLFLT